MSKWLRLEQGEVVARSTCAGCGGAVQWKATRHGEKVSMVCNNGHRSPEKWGQVCGNKSFPGVHDSQALIQQYIDAGNVPILLDAKTPKPQKPAKGASHDKDSGPDAGPDAGPDTDTDSGGIFGGGLFS